MVEVLYAGLRDHRVKEEEEEDCARDVVTSTEARIEYLT
jgi:hypothetical protein